MNTNIITQQQIEEAVQSGYIMYYNDNDENRSRAFEQWRNIGKPLGSFIYDFIGSCCYRSWAEDRIINELTNNGYTVV